MDQKKTPLLDALNNNRKKGRITFHVPAHLGRGLPAFKETGATDMFALDKTEIPGLDDLHCATGPIKESQELAAALFGACRTYFLVNGATTGILASHLYYGGSGKKVLLARNAHKSHYSGLILAGSEPYYLPVAYREDIPVNVSPEDVAAALEEHPDAAALFITSPGYHGYCASLDVISKKALEKGVPLVVDEAHGTHFSLSPGLPQGAGEAGASIWIQSTHKSGGALTQGAMLHIGDSKVDFSRLGFILNMIQTSSPSYPIMASLDEARRLLAMEGRGKLEKVLLHLAGLKGKLKAKNLLLPEVKGYRQDPLRLVISSKALQMSGIELAGELRREGIEVELAGSTHVLLIISLFHEQEDFTALEKALTRVTAAAKPTAGLLPSALPPPPKPVPVLTPAAAAAAKTFSIKLEDALGKIAGEMITLCPPGIPFLVPGEKITPPVHESLMVIKKQGLTLQGTDRELNSIKVIA